MARTEKKCDSQSFGRPTLFPFWPSFPFDLTLFDSKYVCISSEGLDAFRFSLKFRQVSPDHALIVTVCLLHVFFI